MSADSACGSAAAAIQPRIVAPAAASAPTSADVELVELACSMRERKSVLLQELAKRIRRRREAARHADAGRCKLADHFAERRVLAADLLEIAHAQAARGE